MTVPATGIAIIGYILFDSEQNAKLAGTTWLLVGLVLYVARKTLRRRV